MTFSQEKIDLALSFHKEGNIKEAEKLYKSLLDEGKNEFEALHMLGLIEYQNGNIFKALDLIVSAVNINPFEPAAFSNLGAVYKKINRTKQALENYSKAISLDPKFASALSNRGIIYKEEGELELALADLNMAIEVQPDYAQAYVNRGNVLKELKNYIEAIESYKIAIKIMPSLAQAYFNYGNLMKEIGDYIEAEKYYDESLKIDKKFIEAYISRGNLYRETKRLEQAIEDYKKAKILDENFSYLLGMYSYTCMNACDWSEYEKNKVIISTKIINNQYVSPPLPLLSLIDDPELHMLCSKMWVESRNQHRQTEFIKENVKNKKIKIGYYSADYHNHATSYLLIGLLELHNRDDFEIIGFSFGLDIKDEMRIRVQKTFDKFYDVSKYSDKEIVDLSRKIGIDIAIDLKGYTSEARTGIFSNKCASIQVQYLGYPGTMGANYIDYIIADKIVIPDAYRKYYSEKIIYMPHSYQINDGKRFKPEKKYSRLEMGLPENSFIFCCFNNNFKIVPEIFKVWMNMLLEVDGSVLWLFQDNELASENLRNEAKKFGISSERLIFAPKLQYKDHLSRYYLADLFLDTYPYNAHTTASDALWTGLPVITLAGKSFASRVGASILNSLDMQELIAENLQEYQKIIKFYALNNNKLNLLKEKLLKNLEKKPLFDTALFVNNIEAAYKEAYVNNINNREINDIYVN